MNKRMISGILAAVLCVALSGCGSYRTDEDMVIPSMPPVLTPDADDGVVTDRDGVIEDRDTGRTARDDRDTDERAADDERNGDGLMGNLMPSAPVQSTRPEATRQPGTKNS